MIQPATAARLSLELAREQSSSRLPSLAAGIVRAGGLVWSDAVGSTGGRTEDEPVDAGTQYRIGSITKTFVAVAVMRLRDEGRLGLDDPLGRHVPDTELGHVTIAQLLSHASGVQAETDGPWWERTPGADWSDLAGTFRPRHRPGRRFHYSNVGFAMLGEVIARLRGRAWDEVIRAELHRPLGMTRTTSRPVPPRARGLAVHPFADLTLPEPEHDARAMAPAGQFWSTVTDLSRWATFLAGDTADLLSADTLAEMIQPLVVDDTPGDPWTAAYGLGVQLWNIDGRRYLGHGGSMPGFLAFLRVDTDSGDGVVGFTNTTTGLSRGFGSLLLDTFTAAEPIPPEPWQPQPTPAEVLELLGHWYWGPALFELRALPDGWLNLGPAGSGSRASRFRPAGDGSWVGLDGYYAGEPLRVVRRADGSVRHLDLASFCFTRVPYDARADVPGGVDPAGWC